MPVFYALNLRLNEIEWVADTPAQLTCYTGAPHFNSKIQRRLVGAIFLCFL